MSREKTINITAVREDATVITAQASSWTAAAREVMRLFLQRDAGGGGLVLGTVLPSPEVDPLTAGYPRLRALNGDGIWLAGWSLFKPAIAGLAAPGMPRVSPGMEVPGGAKDRYDVLAFTRTGKTTVFAKH